ncbi:hypothetical protein [Arthrobacter pityocampae]|uniref:hypothetical protein n=1 Tax=Arthrobacter pityocampae TaxID=547334 RepID=UPI003736905F
MVVDDGDPVTVEFTTAGIGQSKAHVSSRSTAQPRPRTGRVTQVPAGSPTIKVEAAGVTYDAEQVEGPYVLDDVVHLDWGAGRPRVIGKSTISTSSQPPAVIAPPKPPPPARRTTGYQSGAATRSRTYWAPGGWGSYAGDGNKVHQGTYGGATVTGAWFYGTQFRNLVGRRITKVQFRTGDRLAIGNHGLPATFRFYAHTNPTQPGGDTNRTAGPFTWTAAPGQGPTWIELPEEFGDIIAAGGGIAIAGEPYAGMQGATSRSPESGALILDWSY